MTPDYVTVYEISKESIDWWFILPGVFPAVVSVLLILIKRRFKWEKPRWTLPIFMCGFGLLWIFIVGVSVLPEHFKALKAYRQGDYRVVEGQVIDFQPMPYEGHQSECFSVQDQRFCYSDFEIAPGFRNTTSHGGPIHAGLPVRIAYREHAILRLDVPKDQVPTAAQSKARLESNEEAWQTQSDSDPTEVRMTTAFFFTAVCLTLWWNIQWRRVMRFWVRPPNRRVTQYGFRIFFALNFLGAIRGLVSQLRQHPVTRDTALITVETTAIMLAVVGVFFGFGLWMITRWQTKREQGASL